MIRKTFTGILLAALTVSLWGAEPPLRFATEDHGDPGDKAPIIPPWKRIVLDEDAGGHWVVTGDLDGDGQVDIVSCENVNKNDVHYTSTAVAQRLDGSVLWRWGNPAAGRKKWHHDVACQIHDWDGDGRNEVILCTQGRLVALDGRTGREIRSFQIPGQASDCLVFADLSGRGHATDILVKTRYSQIWAYNQTGKLLWTSKNPGGFRTAHQPRPMDLDGDGRDEIMAGYALLNADGSVRWTYQSKAVNQARGHLDCARLFSMDQKPGSRRIVLTCCGADNIACIDGQGRILWEKSGHHFESIQVGTVVPDAPAPQILVDIDHRPRGESPLWLLDADGRHLGTIMSDYCRHHALLDWTGDGCCDILIADGRGVFNGRGKRIATFDTGGKRGIAMQLGDMTGDQVPDVTIVTADPPTVHIFKNKKGKPHPRFKTLGCGVNFTLY